MKKNEEFMTVITNQQFDCLIFITNNYKSFLLNLIRDHKNGTTAQITRIISEIPIPEPAPKIFLKTAPA